MMARWLSGISTAALALVHRQRAQASAGSSPDRSPPPRKAPMEGVIVSAKQADSNITVSVISNAQGRFTLSRPTGWRPANTRSRSARSATTSTAPKHADDRRPAGPRRSISSCARPATSRDQLTNAEWMISMPGSDDDKLQLINCVSCHTLERIMKSTHNADEFVQLITAHERLCAGEPADQAAAARRPVARLQSGAVPQAGRIPRQHQSERERHAGATSSRPCRASRAAAPM